MLLQSHLKACRLQQSDILSCLNLKLQPLTSRWFGNTAKILTTVDSNFVINIVIIFMTEVVIDGVLLINSDKNRENISTKYLGQYHSA